MNEETHIEVEVQSDIPVIRPEGDLTFSSFRGLKGVFEDQMAEGNEHLILDLSLVGYIDSSGLGLLASLASSLRQRRGDLRLACVGSTVLETLEVTRLIKFFQVFPDRSAAVESFSAQDSGEDGREPRR